MQATVIAAGVGFVLALILRGANARENVARSLFAEDREIGKLKKKRLQMPSAAKPSAPTTRNCCVIGCPSAPTPQALPHCLISARSSP